MVQNIDTYTFLEWILLWLPSLLFCTLQRLASDFLSDYIFLTVGKVGSSTDLIAQRVELVQDMDKRSRLLNLLCSQNPNGTRDKVSVPSDCSNNMDLWFLATVKLWFLFHTPLCNEGVYIHI